MKERERRIAVIFYKIFRRVTIFTASVFVVATFFYACTAAKAERVAAEITFYFLADGGENTEACVAASKILGGAGYYYADSDVSAAVYACYRGEARAEEARKNLLKNTAAAERDIFVLKKTVGGVYLKTAAQKRNKTKILNALSVLNGCAVSLETAISAAESGTQRSLRMQAYDVSLVLNYLKKSAEKFAEEKKNGWKILSKTCGEVADFLREKAAGIIFGSDLRYAHAAVCEGILRFSASFSL